MQKKTNRTLILSCICGYLMCSRRSSYWLRRDSRCSTSLNICRRLPYNQCCGSGSGIRCLYNPWIRDPGWEKVRIRIRDEQPGSYFPELINHFFGLKYLNSLMRIQDPGSGMETIRIRDPAWKNVGSGFRDKHPGSATLRTTRHT